MSIRIHKPGVQASIQDLGRKGFQHWGIPVGGVMDENAAKLANVLCENPIEAALIEFTLHGGVLEFTDHHRIALSGGGCRITINGHEVPMNQLLSVEQGGIMKMQPSPLGCRTYLAIEGGFDVMNELGSVATYLPAALGGIYGRNLLANDVLPVKKQTQVNRPSLEPTEILHQQSAAKANSNSKGFLMESPQVSIVNQALATREVWIDACQGPEWDWFDTKSQEAFFSVPWKIDAQSNRMGYRLYNTPLDKIITKELISTPVTRGIIQVTADGTPLLLMADAQTIGGYPRIARVCPADLSILAQCSPGYTVHFKLISNEASLQKSAHALSN